MAAQGCHIVLLCLLVALVPGGAAADEGMVGACPAEVDAAVASLSGDAVGPLAVLSCPRPGLVVVEATPPGAPALRLELRSGSEGFVVAGAFGISPVFDGDWSTVPQPWREAVTALAGRLESAGGDLNRALLGVGTPVPPGFLPETPPARAAPPPPSIPWLAVLGLAALGLALGRRGTDWRGELRALAPPLAAALALRWFLGAWAPLHPNGQGSLWLLSAWGKPELVSAYGPGFPELFTWVARAAAVPDTAVFLVNGLLGLAAVACAFALARVLGCALRPARVAAWVVACEPFLVRFAVSESYYPVIVAGVLGAAACLAAATAPGDDAGPRRREEALERVAFLVAGCLFLAQVARVQPLAWPLVAVAPLAGLAHRGPVLRSFAASFAAGLAALATVLGTSHRSMLAVWERLSSLGPEGPIAEQTLQPPGFGFVVAAILWVVAARSLGPRAVRVALAVVPMCAAYTATHGVFLESAEWAGIHRAAYLALPATLVVATAGDRRWLGPLLGALLVVGGTDELNHRTTEQLEYRWVRGHLRALGEGARLAYVGRAGRRVMTLPEHLVPGWDCGTTSGMRVDENTRLDDGLDPGETRYYYRSAMCASEDAAPICAAAEQSAELVEVARTSLPAVPTMKSLPYLDDPITVILYRVEPHSGSTGYPPAP